MRRLFRNDAEGDGPAGPRCARRFAPADRTDEVFGVWSGRRAASGETWAQIELEAQRDYASQGWATFEDVPDDPAELGCDVLHRVGHARAVRPPAPTRRDAMLEGALVPGRGGLPRGTELFLEADRFDVAPGRRVALTLRARVPRAPRARDRDAAPATGAGAGPGASSSAGCGRAARRRPPSGSRRRRAHPRATRRVRVEATLSAGGRTGSARAVLRVVPPVRAMLAPLPQVAEFRAWARRAGVQRLDGLVTPVATLAAGGATELRVDLRNHSGAMRSGTVALRLPRGFAADAASKPYPAIAPGGRGAVSFRVTNTNARLPTSEDGGDRSLAIVTTTGRARSTERAALELVPATTIPAARAAPVLDGVGSPGEYPGAALDLSRRWEGEKPRNARDASGTARLAWAADALYVLVDVTDDELGTVLPAGDAKRHWRTDSAEIALDPGGGSENTSTTFKLAVFPTTREGGAVAARDADNRQGPAAQTAPGTQVVSRLGAPYDGYTAEVRIPFADLPAPLAAGAAGLNVLVYDSDTQDKTGQTRLGWSTWGGVQGDPYRWGRATLAGFTPPGGGPERPLAPVFPGDAARSADSPQSLLQAARDRAGLAGGPLGGRVRIAGRPRLDGGDVVVDLRAGGPGTAHVFVTGSSGRGLAARVLQVPRGATSVRVPVAGGLSARVRAVVVGFEAPGGGSRAVAAPVGGG